jgi:hypothetical protein
VLFTNTRSVLTHEAAAGATRFVSCGFLDPKPFVSERVSDRGVKNRRKERKPPPTQCEDSVQQRHKLCSFLDARY